MQIPNILQQLAGMAVLIVGPSNAHRMPQDFW